MGSPLPGELTAHRPGRGIGVTVYVSRNAMADQSRRPEPGRASSQWPVQPADPPLLTHVWRRLFDQQAREGGRR